MELKRIIKEEINNFDWVDNPEDYGIESGRGEIRGWVEHMIDTLNDLYKDLGYTVVPSDRGDSYDVLEPNGDNYTVINPTHGWDSVLSRLKRDYSDIVNVFREGDPFIETAKQLYIRAYDFYKEQNRVRNLYTESLNEARIKVGKDEYIKLFEDKTIMALKPLTHQASCKYGSGTKWCVTMRNNDKYWKDYTRKTSSFGGTNWYNAVDEVEEELERSWLDRLLGRPAEVVTKEVKEFIEEFPVGILYFVVLKKRIVDYEYDEELKYNKPIYETADPKDPMNKLALLYRPGRADFGDMSWWEKDNPGDFYGYISSKLDSSHNNMSIFNALDQKVTLREVNKTLGRQFSAPFAFIEEDFQKERDAIDKILKNVLDKVYPLPGAEGSKDPRTWMNASDGNLYSADTSDMHKDNKGRTHMRRGKNYKGGAW